MYKYSKTLTCSWIQSFKIWRTTKNFTPIVKERDIEVRLLIIIRGEMEVLVAMQSFWIKRKKETTLITDNTCLFRKVFRIS